MHSRPRRLFRFSSVIAIGVLTSCGSDPFGLTTGDPRLAARPGTPTMLAEVGESELGLSGGGRDGLLYVPTMHDREVAVPLLVMLHGAQGSAAGLKGLFTWAEEHGFAVLLPDARRGTWHGVGGLFGPDVEFLDLALQHVFDRWRVDPARIALAGFSDGASYALSLGVSNGDLFSHLVAFSPGFFSPAKPVVGRPRVYISHGTFDNVLPISSSRDIIVPWFTDEGYDLTFDEWAGGHELTSESFGAGLSWWW